MQDPRKGIYVAVLNQGYIRVELVFLLINMFQQKKYKIFLDTPAGKPIEHNRNVIVQNFLKSGYDYLLMLDNDIIPPMNVIELADHEKDIVGMVCFAFKAKPNRIMPLVLEYKGKNEDGRASYNIPDLENKDGLIEVDAVGTGAIMIHRRVFEHKDMKHPFQNYWNEDGIRTEGLDLSFCRRAKEAGFKVWADLNMVASHWTELDLKIFYEALSEKKDEVKVSIINKKEKDVFQHPKQS